LFHVEQSGEERLGWEPGTNQVPCWMTYTTSETAEIVKQNLTKSPMYSGEIKSTGPRYCPSIEDKFVRFADKPRHLLFLEPEGRTTNEYYINGLSTSLPFDVQIAMVRSIPGLERAELLRPAYAVEYDFAPPTQLFPSLESKKAENLFFAGQINGTSGYEEAAAQGLVAGVNAVNKARGNEPMIIGRHEAYIGVLIDDLVTKGTKEPYRMFTSRAEHRLLFNHGSAENRLLHHAATHGLVGPERLTRMQAKVTETTKWIEWIEAKRPGGEQGTYGDHFRRASQAKGATPTMPDDYIGLPIETQQEIEYRVNYRGYLEREQRQVEKLKHIEKVKIPSGLNYQEIKGLRTESATKLSETLPINLGQASRISGVNPSDISILLIYIEAARRAKSTSS